MTTQEKKRLEKLEKAVEELRRELHILIPTETLSEYRNAKDIKRALTNARRERSRA